MFASNYGQECCIKPGAGRWPVAVSAVLTVKSVNVWMHGQYLCLYNTDFLRFFKGETMQSLVSLTITRNAQRVEIYPPTHCAFLNIESDK